MSQSNERRKKLAFLRYAMLTAAIPGVFIGGVARADDAPDIEGNPIETIVVTGTKFNAEIAPAKASLETEQPQTIINKDYIENFMPPQASYVDILAITPGMTGTEVNGPGLSDGGPKNTLRGFTDQFFGMSYDGIPFGDTNGPSHHSVSYFPGSTIGSIVVDRSPGNAGTIGAATYGGNIQMYSEPLIDQPRGKAQIGYGSFNTVSADINQQTGDFLGGTRALLNLDELQSSGYLTYQDVQKHNVLLKMDHKFGDNWDVTVFANYEDLVEHLEDNAGATPAQIMAYGKNFAMQGSNPNLPTYYAYNWTTKRTDFEYVRLQGNITSTLKLDNTIYTYAYFNHTFSSTDDEQTAADIAANTGDTSGVPAVGQGTILNGVKMANDIPGYSKQNEYRVQGDITRLTQDYSFGAVTGQVKAGLWWEASKTPRARYDYDMNACFAQGINPFAVAATQSCADSSLGKKSVLTPHGYAEYDEHTSWYQYQPFVDIDIHPFTDDLTITPGYKYVDWLHKSDALVEPKLLQPLNFEYTTKQSLFYGEANYKITKSWSVYAQYAQGVYVPDIGALEIKTPVLKPPAAETSTNYQAGTVFYADNFSLDADVYKIHINNNYVAEDCSLVGSTPGEDCYVNTGTATYKGIEGEGTYAFRGDLQGLLLFVNGALMSTKSNGLWLKSAPFWTAAAGIMYQHEGWKFSLIDKSTGPQYSDNANNPLYKLTSFSEVNLIGGKQFGFAELDLSINNLFNSRHVVSITENGTTAANSGFQPGSLDQYLFEAPRSFMLTAKIHW